MLDTIDDAERDLEEQHARLVILKAWLKNTKKRLLEWNGVLTSALIADKEFLNKLASASTCLDQGDALDVEITFKQHFDPSWWCMSIVMNEVFRCRQSLQDCP